MATKNTDDEVEEKKMPLLDHLIELRQRFLYSGLAFILALIIGVAFSRPIFRFLMVPLEMVYEGQTGRRMIYTGVMEAFTTYLWVGVYTALCIAFPIIASQIWMFVAPGLYRNERKAFLPFLIATPIMFILGAAVLYFFILPVALRFFASFEEIVSQGQQGLSIQLEARISEYLDFVLKLILAFGLSFELPVLLVLLARVGIVSAAQLASKRRYAIVGVVTFAAIVTPPDVFSQLSLAGPMYLLYEVSIIIARMIERKRDESEDEEKPAPVKPVATAAGAAAAAYVPAALPAPSTFIDETDFSVR